jgi:acetyl-CoA C-acetyltransferase
MNMHLGNLAEKIIAEMGIRREVLEEWTKNSYTRARSAQDNKFLDWEIVDIVKDKGREQQRISMDEEWQRYFPKSIPALFPIYAKNGTLTAASSAKLNDGASVVILMEEEFANELGLRPLARIVAYQDSAVMPVDFTIANFKVTEDILKKAKMNLSDIGFHEIHENFASVPLANIRLLDLDPETVNLHGGAVALGHPLGMSGNRIVISLINVLRRMNSHNIGLASICHGGGGASAVIIERLN